MDENTKAEQAKSGPCILRNLRKISNSGILCSVLGNFFLAASYVVIKSALRQGNTFVVGLLRAATQVFLLLPLAVINCNHPLGKIGERHLVFLWAVSNVFSQFLLVYAFSFISATDASTIVMTYPILITLAGPALLSQPFRKTYFLSAVLTVAGVFLIGRPSFLFPSQDSASSRTIGICLSLGSALSAGITCLANSKIQHTAVWIFLQQFALLSVINFLAAIGLSEKGFFLPATSEWVKGVGSGCLYTTGSALVSLGYQLDEAGPISVVGMLEVPFVLLLQVALLSDVPLWTTSCGVLLVLTGVLMTVLRKWEGALDKLKLFLGQFYGCCSCDRKKMVELNS